MKNPLRFLIVDSIKQKIFREVPSSHKVCAVETALYQDIDLTAAPTISIKV